MGKSQETFSKKEKEKKRLKKRQDKEQKKEERKASSVKGQDLDDMLAYVDDNGNISNTPPDPRKRKEVNQEEIQIGISRQAPPDPADLIRKGTVSFFNTAKGFGFIRDNITQESIFIHQNDLTIQVKENDKVTFETEKSPKGLKAVNVKLATE